MFFFIHTYGCQMNVRDSEAVGALLEACGHQRAADEDAADLVIVNTCSVRLKAEDKAAGKLGLLCASKRERPGRIIGVMGCMAQRMKTSLFKRFKALDFAVGTRAAALVPSVVARAAAGESPVWEDGASALASARADVVTAHQPGQLLAYVTILLGCERRCSYCIVPDVRGTEYSRPGRDVIEEVKSVVAAGAADITLLGQSVMRYGMKGNVWPEEYKSPAGFTEPLPMLFEAIQREVPELKRLRFTSGHPSGVTPELVRAMKELPVLCAHLHLPVQSGADTILARMGRGYTREKYLSSVRALRGAVPDIAITTDVIVGYPGESEAEFEETRSLLEEAEIDNTFIFKYSPRPGTRAAELPDDVSDDEKLRRNHVLLEDQDTRGLKINSRWVGREVEVLAEGVSLRDENRWAGRSPQNKIVAFKPDRPVAAGDIVRVKVTEAHPQTLIGELSAE